MKNDIVKTESHIEENFSVLRTNLRFGKDNKGVSVVTITSPSEEEGKSTITYELAKSFAQDGESVLIIDCNLRSPDIKNRLGQDEGRGLVNILLNDVNPSEVVVGNPEFEHFDVILSGVIPPNISELLGSKKMDHLIQSVKEHYDYVFLDAPAMNFYPEAGILANYSDGTLLVVSKGVTEASEVDKAIRRIEYLDGRILGFVLNNMENI